MQKFNTQSVLIVGHYKSLLTQEISIHIHRRLDKYNTYNIANTNIYNKKWANCLLHWTHLTQLREGNFFHTIYDLSSIRYLQSITDLGLGLVDKIMLWQSLDSEIWWRNNSSPHKTAVNYIRKLQAGAITCYWVMRLPFFPFKRTI